MCEQRREPTGAERTEHENRHDAGHHPTTEDGLDVVDCGRGRRW